MSDVFGDTTDREASPADVARIAAIVASDFRLAYFGTAAFVVRLLRLDQKLMDGIPMNPRRMANLLNVTSTPMAGRLRYRLFEPAGARASVPRNYRYFNDPLIDVNLAFSFVPRPFTTAMIASAIPARSIHIRLPSRQTGQPGISEPM
jgi:hypothetical protein